MNPSILITPNSKKAGKLDSIIPTDGTGDLDVVRATTATYVGSDGLIKTALANEPRFDYTNGSCPSILVEPQRTNLCLQSEKFDLSTWKIPFNGRIVSSTLHSPDGIGFLQRLEEFNKGSGVNLYETYQTINFAPNTTYVASFFLKPDQITQVRIAGGSFIGTPDIIFDLSTKQRISGLTTFSFVEYPDNIIKLSLVFTTTNTTTGPSPLSIRLVRNGSSSYPLVNTGDGLFIWGAQLEVGSNATSYIPTTSSTVTRNADVISKKGISSLIGQTEGTIYIDANINYTALRSGIFLVIRNQANASNRIQIFFNNNANNNIAFNHVFNSINNLVSSNIVSTGNVKIAIAYKSGQPTIMYINGVSYSTSGNIGSFTDTIDSIYYGIFGDSTSAFYDGLLGNAMIFKTRLTNTDCEILTGTSYTSYSEMATALGYTII